MDVLPYVSHYLQIIVYSQSWEYCHDKIFKVYFQSLWVLVVGARCGCSLWVLVVGARCECSLWVLVLDGLCECSLRELVQFY